MEETINNLSLIMGILNIICSFVLFILLTVNNMVIPTNLFNLGLFTIAFCYYIGIKNIDYYTQVKE